MTELLKGGLVATCDGIKKQDVRIEDGIIVSISDSIPVTPEDEVIPCDNFFVTPGLIDVHVHLREPGFTYKETIKSGSLAAFHAGYQAVFAMPNVDPSPVDLSTLAPQKAAIEKDAATLVVPYGRITKDRTQLSDMAALAPYVCAFSDDGFGVQEEALMESAMETAKKLGKIIVEHCEDERYDTYDDRSESLAVARNCRLAEKTGAAFHACHISAKDSVTALRAAKEKGADVTCETAPHYLFFDNEALPDDGRYKMNPPIRTKEDQGALWEGLFGGTIDMIITDHAPHSAEEKSKGFDSLFGIVGLETAFPVMYTKGALSGKCTLEDLHRWMCTAPYERFGIGTPHLAEGAKADFFVFDLKEEYTIDPEQFYSMGKSTPFAGQKVCGKAKYAFREGKKIEL